MSISSISVLPMVSTVQDPHEVTTLGMIADFIEIRRAAGLSVELTVVESRGAKHDTRSTGRYEAEHEQRKRRDNFEPEVPGRTAGSVLIITINRPAERGQRQSAGAWPCDGLKLDGDAGCRWRAPDRWGAVRSAGMDLEGVRRGEK